MPSAVFLGLATVDIIYAVDGIPAENHKAVAHRQEVLCGGPAANAAITCAFLGSRATLVSAVGAHPLANIIRHDLQQVQVALQDLAPASNEIPSLSSILVNPATGSRTVISGHATRTQASAKMFDAAVLGDAAVLLVDGQQMSCAIRAAAEAQARSIPVVFDGGSWKDRTAELLAHTQIAICSEIFRPPGTASTLETIAYLLDRGPEAVAITRGENSILWATHDDKGELPVPSVTAVDTLGAGDIFHGAFCHRLIEGATFVEALAFAAQVAAYSCRFFGTRAWMCSWPKAKTSLGE